MVAWIWAKLSVFVREYSSNICCEFYSNNWNGLTDTAVWTLNFIYLKWTFTSNKSNFAQLFVNSSNVSVINVRCLRLILYLNRLFSMSVPTCCSNTWLKSVAKWYNCLINERMKQIILYGRQNGLLVRHDVDQLWHVPSIVFQYSIPTHMIIHWHFHMGHLLLFVHQNRRLVTCSFWKMHF